MHNMLHIEYKDFLIHQTSFPLHHKLLANEKFAEYATECDNCQHNLYVIISE